jgi:hypothetical protein
MIYKVNDYREIVLDAGYSETIIKQGKKSSDSKIRITVIFIFGKTHACLRLVTVIGGLYFKLDHVISVFSLPLDHQRSSSSL